jgi:hypothetical protein
MERCNLFCQKNQYKAIVIDKLTQMQSTFATSEIIRKRSFSITSCQSDQIPMLTSKNPSMVYVVDIDTGIEYLASNKKTVPITFKVFYPDTISSGSLA